MPIVQNTDRLDTFSSYSRLDSEDADHQQLTVVATTRGSGGHVGCRQTLRATPSFFCFGYELD